MRFLFLFCVLCFVDQVGAQGAPKEQVTVVRVAVGKVSEVVFPEKVAKIIKGGAPDSVLVEVLDHSIYVMPKMDTPADIFVTTVSGNSYPLNLTIAAQHDVRVEIGGILKVERLSQDVRDDPMVVMKEILSGQGPGGAVVIKEGQGAVVFKNGCIQLNIKSGYDLPTLTAYILEARNLTDNSVIVPLEQLSFPHLLAAASDRDMIAPKGREGDRTLVYLVVGK